MKQALKTPTNLKRSAVIEQNLMARFAYFSQASRAKLYTDPEMVWFKSDIVFPNYTFNTVLASNFSTPESAYGHITRVLKDAKSRRAPVFWCVGPFTQPADLGDYLEVFNVKHVMTCLGMSLDLDDLNEDISMPAGLTIERVHTLTQLKQFVEVLAANSKMPGPISQAWFEFEASLGFDYGFPRQRYLGLVDGEPVATATMFAGAGVAGLYHVATLPQVRGRGVGTALSLAAMQDARRLGHQAATLISTPMGQNVYRVLGFQPVNEFDIYLWQDAN